MDIIEKFGNRVSNQALKDPEKARRLLLAGYRLQEKKLQFLPDRGLPSSGQYVARVVMKNIIQSLSEPENAAMVSIFVPVSSENGGRRISGDDVFVPQGVSGGGADGDSAKTELHDLYEPCV